jgi:putative two-component system response regulator
MPRDDAALTGVAARVLVVDDDPAIRFLVGSLLRDAGYDSQQADCVAGARQRLAESSFDLLLLDLNMPGENGLALLGELGPHMPATAVVVVTANADAPHAVAALKAGAYDYVCKPFGEAELLGAVRTALDRRLRALHEQADREAQARVVVERTEHLSAALARLRGTQGAIRRLACSLAEIRDAETGAHLERMSGYARLLSTHAPCAFRARHGIDDDFAERLAEAAPLHDIGKIGIPDRVLLKPGPLTADEWDLMRRHPGLGRRILENAAGAGGFDDWPVLSVASVICGAHHERYDGSGYPDGLRGEQIPVAARIIAVADVYDALATPRPYRPTAFAPDVVCGMIKVESGWAFDPDVVAGLLNAQDALRGIASPAPASSEVALIA